MQFQLAQLATDIEMARLALYNAARLKDNGSAFLKEAAMCKLVASSVAEKVASAAVEIFGGSGFVSMPEGQIPLEISDPPDTMEMGRTVAV